MQSSPFQTQNEKAKEQSLDSLLKALVGEPSEDQIEARASGFKSARDLADAIDVANAINSATIDPHIIYCNLTGQPIGRRDERNLKMALHVRGKTNVNELIEYGAQTAIADWWIGVSGQSLNNLAELDPCGYYVYAADIAFRHNYKSFFNKKANPKDAINQVQILKQKIALFYKLQQLPITEIIKANEAWRDFLAIVDPSFIPNNIIFPCPTLDGLGDPEMVFGISKHLKNVLHNLLLRQHPQSSRYTYVDIVNLKDQTKGIGVFGAQSHLRDMSAQDSLLKTLEMKFGHGPLNSSAKLPDVKPKKYIGNVSVTKVTSETHLEIKTTTPTINKPKGGLAALLAQSKSKGKSE